MIGYCFCGSFCTIGKSLSVLKTLKDGGADILPVMSETAYSNDTRFGKASDIISEISEICGRDVLHTIVQTEPIGPALNLELLIIAPCTGNTLSKLANGITDSCVTMAAKAQLRSDRPVLIALATNDALSSCLKNIGALLSRKNVFFVPLGQDDSEAKPYSLVCDFQKLVPAAKAALAGKQLQPLLI